jgi:outer membrane protein OmpA-like peptidoglycan-associated protein/translation initiation factor IF-1
MKEFTKLFLLLFANLTFAQQPEYEIFNTSINTEFAEFGVTYSNNNSVIFASSKKTKTEKRHNNRQLHLELYHGIITENGDIIESNKFSKEIKNKFYESDIAFTPDFKTIYFTWNNFYITQRKDSAKWKTLYMFKASINDSFEISNVTPLPFNNKEYSVRSPYVSPNGKQLFFISDMPSGYGGQDIYVVDILPNNEYSKPENLGPLVNTKKNELFPFIDTNNRLYFSSYGHKGLGFLDIFRSEKKDGIYQKPENLPAPINSKYDDFAYVGDNLTNSGYFTSNRKGSKGDVDIYAFKLKEEEIECFQTITGVFVNEKTGEKLDNIQVSLYQNNIVIDSQIVGLGNTYTFKTNCNENYKIIAKNEKFKSAEIEIKTSDKTNSLTQNINLIPIECVQTITGIFVNEKTGEKLDNIQVSLYQNNKKIESQIIGLGNTYTFKTNCNETYKIVAQNEKFKTSEIEIKTGDKSNSLTKNINLIPIECVQTITGVFVNEKTGEKLDNIQVSLYQNNKEIESQIVALGNTYTFKTNCNENYKIVVQNEKFITAEVEIKTSDKSNSLTKNINLTPVECVQTITGVFVNEKTGEKLDNIQVSLYQNNKEIESQIVALGNTYNFKSNCNENYKIIAKNKKFKTTEVEIKTGDKSNSITQNINLTPVGCVQTISGFIFNKNTGIQLDNVEVSLYQDNLLIEKQKVKLYSKYNFKITCNENYKITAQIEGFETTEIDISTNDLTSINLSKDIALIPFKCVQLLTGVVLNDETKDPLPYSQIKVFNENSIIDTIQSDANANFKYELNCKTNYQFIISLINYKNSVTQIQTSNKPNDVIFKEFLIESNVEFVTVRNNKMAKTKPIYFDLNQDAIRPDAAIELTKVVDLMNKYPSMKIEIKSHTDSRAPDNYNLDLTNKRAESSINYIISKGIDSKRISGRGYGETELLNKCSNGVKCTDAEHEQNRRMEFIVIEE